MSRYDDTFEALAQRGTPVGEHELFNSIQAELAGSPTVRATSQRPRRVTSGPMVALAAFVVVLLAGAVFVALGFGGGDDTVASQSEFRFVELDQDLARVQGARGGFVAFDFSDGQVVFSADGENWEPTDIPDFMGFFRDVVATEERWFLAGPETDVMWTSPDGLHWSEIDVPDALSEVFQTMVADSRTVLARTQDPFNEYPPALWKLDEDLQWQPQTPTGLPENDRLTIAGSQDGLGFVAAATDATGFTTWFSDDGSSWTQGTRVVINNGDGEEQVGTFVVDTANGWMALTTTYTTEGTSSVYVHTSHDGRQGTEQPVPPFDDSPRKVLSSDGATIVAARSAVWLTRDGETWQNIHTFATPVTVRGATLVDDQIVILWRPTNSDAATETTIALPPVEPDPAGADLQDEILADGVVTRDEFESAVAGMVECMEKRGVEVLDWSVDADGGYGLTTSGEDADNFCWYSYLDRITNELNQ